MLGDEFEKGDTGRLPYILIRRLPMDVVMVICASLSPCRLRKIGTGGVISMAMNAFTRILGVSK
jgi:hypothetical protein